MEVKPKERGKRKEATPFYINIKGKTLKSEMIKKC
jgi:hypothetical protein